MPPDSLAFALFNAVPVVTAVQGGQSLAEGLLARVPPTARPAVQDLVYGTLRRYGRGDAILADLLERPLTVPPVQALLLLALYRLESWPEDPHTVVNQAVEAAGRIAGGRLKGLVNAVLRNYLRRRETIEKALLGDEVSTSMHPEWWLRRLQSAYPQDWEAIVAAGNSLPPMALRVNRRRGGRGAYAAELAAAGLAAAERGEDGLLLQTPVPV